MPDAGPGGAEQPGSAEEGSEPSSDSNPNPDPGFGHGPLGEEENGGKSGTGSQERPGDGALFPPVLSIVIVQPEVAPNPKDVVSKSGLDVERDEVDTVAAAKKGCLPRSESDREQCRVCQQQTEEPLMDLGCRCRGELAIAHRSCIEIWFRTRGSNKCEICQQVAANVPSPESQPSNSYWIWRINSTYGGINIGRGDRARGCYSPLWVAFAILIGGLLLDILISVSLGVSALPVNIIIGVLIVLGLGTVIRLALECFNERRSRRSMERPDTTINHVVMNPGYHLAV